MYEISWLDTISSSSGRDFSLAYALTVSKSTPPRAISRMCCRALVEAASAF